MIHIYKNYYCSSDGINNIILYEKFTIKESRLTKQENVGKDRFEAVAYYTSIEDLISGMLRKEQMKTISSYNNDIVEIKEVLDYLAREFAEIKNVLDIGNLRRMIKDTQGEENEKQDTACETE